MKKKILTGLLIIVMCFTLVSCSENETTNNLSSNNEDIPTTKNNNSKSNSDSIPISEITGLYTNDLPLGLETTYLKVNGNDIVIRIQTTGSSKQQKMVHIIFIIMFM